MTAVNPNQTTTYTLSGGYAVTFGTGTNIDVPTYESFGVYGSASVDWNVTNSGTIYGGSALYFKGGATVVNGASGTLGGPLAGGYGIQMKGVGSVTNAGSIFGRGRIATLSGPEGGTAIFMAQGGTVFNEATGTIEGAVVLGKMGDVTNAGSIISGGQGSIGIDLSDGGEVTNYGSIGVSGNYATGISLGTGGTAINTGKIIGSAVYYSVYMYGIYAASGGTIVNGGIIKLKTSGTADEHVSGIKFRRQGSLNNKGIINVTVSTGHAYGVELLARGSVTNSGTIKMTAPSHGEGVLLAKGGTVDNLAGGSISGGALTGIYAQGSKGVSITNAGKISGADASVVFADVGKSSAPITNTLTLKTGSDLIGRAVGAASAFVANDLVFEGDGTASNVFADFQALTVQAAASWTLSAAAGIATTKVKGVLTVSQTGSLSGALTIEGGDAIFDSTYDGDVTFDGAGKLELSDPYTGVLSGIGAKDRIEFLGLAFETGDEVSVVGDVLNVESASHAPLATLTLDNSTYSSSNFTVGRNASGHILVKYT